MSLPSEPTQDLAWSTNTDYAAGSEVGNPTKVEPVSGRKADGWSPETKPSPQQMNWWFNGVKAWVDYFVTYLAYLLPLVTSRTQHRLPTAFLATNWASTTSGGLPCLESSGSGDAYVDLELNEGEQLDGLTFTIIGNGTVDGSITVQKHFSSTSGTAPATVASATLTNVSASWQAFYMNLQAHETDGLTITVDHVAATFTRSAGSYLTEGYYVGQNVTWAGLVHSGNNGATVIASLTDTVMGVTSVTLVDETSTAGASVAAAATLATVDDTFCLVAKLSANATGLAARSMRIVSDLPAV